MERYNKHKRKVGRRRKTETTRLLMKQREIRQWLMKKREFQHKIKMKREDKQINEPNKDRKIARLGN